MNNKFSDFIILAISLLFVIITHELGHAIVALWNGDDTAKNEGRITFNPLKHLDLMGTLFLIVLKFGWAKPVPINSNKFKNERLGLFTVSIAGIMVNLMTCFFAILINNTLLYFQVFNYYLYILFNNIAVYSVVFAIFNLLPIPPLDGSKILASILPKSFEYFIYKNEKYSYIILIVLLYLGVINKIIIPVIKPVLNFFNTITIYILQMI
ncbi:site-2 protease family protein [Helcococcus bovis]|uniref:site-2 protease family protein n=1 Tax=Helcococcus bovis TaxID=3153252 RepID=UPI0038BD1B62